MPALYLIKNATSSVIYSKHMQIKIEYGQLNEMAAAFGVRALHLFTRPSSYLAVR
jgi:hypothetical protein